MNDFLKQNFNHFPLVKTGTGLFLQRNLEFVMKNPLITLIDVSHSRNLKSKQPKNLKAFVFQFFLHFILCRILKAPPANPRT